jgi:hypothetical protein
MSSTVALLCASFPVRHSDERVGPWSEPLLAKGHPTMPTTPLPPLDDLDTAHVFVELGLGHAIVPAIQESSFGRGEDHRDPRPPADPGRVGSPQLPPAAPVSVAFMAVLAETASTWTGIPGVRLLGTR